MTPPEPLLPDGRDVLHRLRQGKLLLPGLLICLTIALAASYLSEHHGGPVMLFALLLGIAFAFLSKTAECRSGIEFSARSILRFGIALLGLRITLGDVAVLGPMPVVLAVVGVVLSIGFGVLMARALGFNSSFGILTGGSVGICGASAALALSSVLEKGPGRISERDTVFAVLSVTSLSTVAMIVYPAVALSLGFSDVDSGILLGATIHDVAQAIGAGYSISPQAGDAATLTKLLRVAMLVPVVFVLTILLAQSSRAEGGGNGLPLFLVAFVVLVIINSLGWVPDTVGEVLSKLSSWSLVTAISAIGMKTALGDLAAMGSKAIILVLAETLWLALIVLSAIWFYG